MPFVVNCLLLFQQSQCVCVGSQKAVVVSAGRHVIVFAYRTLSTTVPLDLEVRILRMMTG